MNLTRDNGQADCTLGTLSLEDFTCDSIELPWVAAENGGKGGKRGHSCIPHGTYQLEPHDSEAHPATFALVNHELDIYHHEWEATKERRAMVRSEILIHPLSYPAQLAGCVGVSFARVYDQDAQRWTTGGRSREAFEKFKEVMRTSADRTLVIQGV